MHEKFISQHIVKPWKEEQKKLGQVEIRAVRSLRDSVKGLNCMCWNKWSYQCICWNKWVSFEKMAKFLTLMNKGACLILVGKFGQFLFKNYTRTGWEFFWTPSLSHFWFWVFVFLQQLLKCRRKPGKKDKNLLGLCQYLKQVGKVKVITWALVSES